jgi:hypothetical protein
MLHSYCTHTVQVQVLGSGRVDAYPDDPASIKGGWAPSAASADSVLDPYIV